MQDSANYDFKTFAGLPSKILMIIFEHEIKRDESILKGLDPAPAFTSDREEISSLLYELCTPADLSEWPQISTANFQNFPAFLRTIKEGKRGIDTYLRELIKSTCPEIIKDIGMMDARTEGQYKDRLASLLHAIITEESLHKAERLKGIDFSYLGGKSFSLTENRFSNPELNRVILESAFPGYITRSDKAEKPTFWDSAVDSDHIKKLAVEHGADVENSLLIPVNEDAVMEAECGVNFTLHIDARCFETTAYDSHLFADFQRWFRAERKRRGFSEGRNKDVFGNLLDLGIYRLINSGLTEESSLVAQQYKNSLPQRKAKDPSVRTPQTVPKLKDFVKQSKKNIRTILKIRKE